MSSAYIGIYCDSMSEAAEHKEFMLTDRQTKIIEDATGHDVHHQKFPTPSFSFSWIRVDFDDDDPPGEEYVHETLKIIEELIEKNQWKKFAQIDDWNYE